MDRLVQVYKSSNKEEESTETLLSKALIDECIVLLGEPGSGKSFCFNYFSDQEGGKVHRASHFYMAEKEELYEQTVYIDGLDEERISDLGGSNIREIVKKLNKFKPSRIRISCRAIDWLGDTDLHHFLHLFEKIGTFKVVALKPLTASEIRTILSVSMGGNEESFISSVSQKGIAYMLENPLTLTMLVELANNDIWPKDKYSLFLETSKILLVEKNKYHLNNRYRKFTTDELLGIAGKVCAHILISGVHFRSLESSNSDTEASFDELKFGHIDEIKTVLSTKAFSMVSNRFFMPKHRALAEFLGAYWLKMQLNQKLTLTRFLNIIGYDNFPATELRGLFAWLSTSNLFAQHLIHLDPLGALLYGDVEQLSEANKLKLIQAMNSVAESDPFFNPDQSNDDLLVHLSTPHNTRLFQTILEDSKATIGMRRFTLRVIEQGPKLPHLEKLLVSHLYQGVPYVLRYQAINTIFNSLPNGPSLLIEHFRSGFNSEDEDAKYLKVLIINNAYGYGLHAEDVVETLLNFLVEGREIYGSLWKFGLNIPSEDLPLILDLLPSNILPLIEKENVEISTEILGLIDFFICRCIKDKTVENEQLYRWLSDYYQYKRHFNFLKKEGVYSLLKSDKELVWALFQIHMAQNLSSPRLEWNKFRLILLDALDHDYFIRNLYELCLRQHYSDTTNNYLFEITLLLTINLGGERHVNIFNHIMDISNSSNDLKTIAQNSSFCELETWRDRENERVKRQLEERRKAKEKNITLFDEDYKTVSKSDKKNWLIFSSRLYLAAGYSSVNDLPHRERLQTFVGSMRANILMNWLADYVRNGIAIKLEDVVENYRKNTYLAESYIILAGLDIYWEKFGNLNGIPTKLLEVAIVLNLQITTFSRLTGPTIPDNYKWVENLREQKPVLFERPYLGPVDLCCIYFTQQYMGSHIIENASDTMLA